MKALIVSFEITSLKYSLNELSSKIGLQFASGSFDKGKIYRGKVSEQTVWKLFSNVDKFGSLEEHCKDIFSLLAKANILRSGEMSEDCNLTLNIGVLFSSDNVSCSVNITSSCLELMKSYKLNIEVSCYPSSEC
jgi:hypothetical protein